MTDDVLYSGEILKYLGSCKPYPDSEAPSKRAIRVRTAEIWSRNVALVMLVVVVVLALVNRFQPLVPWLSESAKLLGVLGLLAWAFNVFIGLLVGLFRFRSWNSDITDFDVRSDGYLKKTAQPLLRCEPEQLKFVDARLADRFEAINGRMSILFGENIFKAGAAVIIFGAMDNLSKLPEQARKLGFPLEPRTLIWIGIYLVLFSMVMPMALKIFASRYPFQRRIIKVALELKELQKSDARVNFKAPGFDDHQIDVGMLGG